MEYGLKFWLCVFLQIIKTTNNKGGLYVPQHSSVIKSIATEKNRCRRGKKELERYPGKACLFVQLLKTYQISAKGQKLYYGAEIREMNKALSLSLSSTKFRNRDRHRSKMRWKTRSKELNICREGKA